MIKRVPVYILSGFLGSGKTTVLVHFLEHCKRNGLQPGIILNEIGETNVEGHLFDNQRVVELLNGCICCTLQEDLKETMDELVREMTESPLDVLFIEGTGVANPLEIQEVLLSTPYREQFDLMSILTVVDASHYTEYQSVFSSSAEVRKLMTEQLVCGSLILLNKTDLVSDKQLEKVKQKVLKIAGEHKKLVECAYGEVDANNLMEKTVGSLSVGNSISPASTHEHHHHDHSTVQTITLENLPPFNQTTVTKWFKQLPPSVLRGKGYLQLDEPKQLVSFQYASNKVKFTPISSSGERESIVILIGMEMDKELMNERCEELLQLGNR
ncbi:GTP-binding protein [Sporosarcina sp. BI001-red]|uniref:CobW family GTP-binding protein n=1 Tax=Sporosarcina sp. BI001-red TaxID=2282866 RepID=UPI000E255F01|nr:GTP-binding protein [Sporosarcina sp. BI001-red]REB04713.1 GTP-binding protein [Sporosarcina sp. BI001-red]